MIYKNLKEVTGKNFPVIIIGSGPAGITLALSLEQRKIDCLIIEAGQEEYSDESQQNYAAKIIGDQITDLRYSRLRQLGGTSGHWGGWCKPIEQWNVEKWGIEYNYPKYIINTNFIKYSHHWRKVSFFKINSTFFVNFFLYRLRQIIFKKNLFTYFDSHLNNIIIFNFSKCS